MNQNLIGYQKPLKILLAEDNRVNQVLTLGLLSCLGYPCDLAENGKLAIEASERQSYDLILMDCQLPILDGYQAAAFIKERQPLLPIIVAYSANASQIQQEHCQEAGMQFLLPKPVTLESLSHIVDKVYDMIHSPKDVK